MSYEKLELFCHEEVLIVMRCGASFLLFWQEQGQFCLDKPLDEYQRMSHEKPLIFNPAPYLTKLWKWIVNKRRAKASLLSSQMTDSANRCRTEPRESQVLLCRPSEVWGDAAYIVSIRHTFILYLLRIYIVVVVTVGGGGPQVLSQCTFSGHESLSTGPYPYCGFSVPSQSDFKKVVSFKETKCWEEK